MKHFGLGIFISLLMLLGGCANNPYGGVSIDTINKGILIANTELRGANLLFQDLLEEGVITDKSQATGILESFREAQSNLSLAAEAVAIGNVAEAEGGLEKATGTIDVLIALLSPYANEESNQ